MSSNFFSDVGLNTVNINSNYPIKKIGELYDEVQSVIVDGKIYQTDIENPKTIGEDDLVMWFDTSNKLLVSVDANNNVVNDVKGIALRDKSKYGNHLALPVGATGVSYSDTKGMLAFLGNATNSYLTNNALLPASHWANADCEFTYFIVIEETAWSGGVPAVRGLLNFFYASQVGGQETYSGILSDINADQWTFAPVASMGTQVCHPNNTNFNFENKAILAFTYGLNNVGQPFRDLYYNGMFCGRQVNLTGMSLRNSSFILGGYDLLNTYQRYTGFIGEQCLFKRVLSRTEIVKMTEYLNSKWDVFAPRDCDIFCVGGQSNAVGFANGVVPTELKTNGTVGGYLLDPQYWYNTYETPIGCFRPTSSGVFVFYLPTDVNAPSIITGAPTTPDGPATAGCSLWANFADEYYKKTGRYAVFLYTGRPGTSMTTGSQWNPISYRNGTVNFWTDVKNILSPAVLKLENNGWKVKGKYFLWNQGENTADRSNVNYSVLFNDAINLVLNDFGYDRYFFYIIANTVLVGGVNYSQLTQQTYSFPRPDVHMVFDCSVFTKWGSYPSPNVAPNTNAYLADDNHYTRLGYAIAGSESGKQAGEIVNRFSTFTIRDVNTLIPQPIVYPTWDVKYWGALGNGISDDTIAIQNCINNNSRLVYFPAGNYLITGTISVSSKYNLKVVGNGATIFRFGATPGNVNIQLNACRFCTVENLNVYQDVQGLGGNNSCIAITNSYGCVINGCNVGGDEDSLLGSVVGIRLDNPDITLPNNGVYLQFGNTITNCNIYRCQWGIRFVNFTTNVLIEGCNFSYNSLNSILFQNNTTRNTVVGCNFSASNCAIRLDGIGKLVAGECDRLTIKACSFKNISSAGVYLNRTKNICSITGCDFNVAGDNLGLTTPWAFGINNTAPANLPANSKWGIFLEGCDNVNITGNHFTECIYGIGYNGASLINISNNNFLTSSSTIAHIWENRITYTDGTSTYNSNGNIICENVFEGNYSVGAPTLLTKSIRFYSSPTANEASTNHIISNNNNATGFNIFNFIAGTPPANYIIDANYSTIIFDMSANPAGSTFTLHPSFFGREFKITFVASSSITYTYNLVLPANLTNVFLGMPNIICKGISYTQYNPVGPVSAFFTITNIGTYTFTPRESISGLALSNNRWYINSDNTNYSGIQIIGADTVVSKSNVKNINFINPASNRTLTFDGSGFTSSDVGFTFDVYFSDTTLTANNDIRVQNNLGGANTIIYINTRTALKTTIINSTNLNLILTGSANDRYFGYRFIYINGTASDPNEIWRINQF